MTEVWNAISQYWPVVIPIILPFVVALIARCSWTSNQKGWTAFGISALVGVVGAFVASGGLPTAATITEFVAVVYAGSQVAYRAFASVGVTSDWLDALLQVGSE
jgi:hypothetical protein